MGKVPFNARRSDVLWIDPDELILIVDKEHPLYDPRVKLPVNENLVTNILFQMQGILEPILIAKTDEGKAVVVDGRQRTKALRVANERLKEQGAQPLQMPCILKRGKGNDLYSMGVSTNEHRRQDTPKEKAKKVGVLRNQGYSSAHCAEIFGVSVQTIQRWEGLLSPKDTGEKKEEKKKNARQRMRSRKEVVEQLEKFKKLVSKNSVEEIQKVSGISMLEWVLKEDEHD